MAMFDGERLVFVRGPLAPDRLAIHVRYCFERTGWSEVVRKLRMALSGPELVGHDGFAFEHQEGQIVGVVLGGIEPEVRKIGTDAFVALSLGDEGEVLSENVSAIRIAGVNDSQVVGHLLDGLAAAGAVTWKFAAPAVTSTLDLAVVNEFHQDQVSVLAEPDSISESTEATDPGDEADGDSNVGESETSASTGIDVEVDENQLPTINNEVSLIDVPVAAVNPGDDDHGCLDVAESETRDLRDEPLQVDGHDSPPLLQGLLCPNGHLNSMRDSSCRSCWAVVDESQEFVVRPRPLLGALYTSDDRIAVEISAPVVAGSAPPQDHKIDGEIALPLVLSGDGEMIAASHCEFVLKKWSVSVVDLGSQSGTYVLPDGVAGTRVRLREGVPHQLVAGCVIDVAGCILRFETVAHSVQTG